MSQTFATALASLSCVELLSSTTLNSGNETFSFSGTTVLTVFHVSEMLVLLLAPREKVEEGGAENEKGISTAVSDSTLSRGVEIKYRERR